MRHAVMGQRAQVMVWVSSHEHNRVCVLQAAVPALIEWIDAVGHREADKVTEGSELDCIFDSAQQRLDPRILIQGLSKLTRQAVLHTLIDTIGAYLESQQTWLDLAQRGLLTLLVHVGSSMWFAVQQYSQQATDRNMGNHSVTRYFLMLSAASELYFVDP